MQIRNVRIYFLLLAKHTSGAFENVQALRASFTHGSPYAMC